ncbi:MAG: GNAT family N-acetyltransferase [Bacteroidota bacterium]|nr:GNAT family N-acetyltransferase [Bacteroidota bacterium]
MILMSHKNNTQEINTIEELRQIEPEWNALLAKSESPTAYLTYEWLTTWWSCFKTPNKKLLILAVRDNTELIGLAPLMVVEYSIAGIPLRKIEFLSMMRFAYSPSNLAGSLDFIIKTGRHKEVLSSIISYLKNNIKGWLYLRLHPISSDSSSISVLEYMAKEQRFSFHRRIVFQNVRIPIDTTWEEYCLQRGQNFLKKFKSLEKKFTQLGELRYLDITSPTDFESTYNTLTEIEARSWKSKHGLQVYHSMYKNFFPKLAKVCSENDMLRLWILELNGKGIAYDLSITYSNKIESLISTYDKSYAKYSPGHLLSYHAFYIYFQEKLREINLLWGELGAKSKWTSTFHKHDEIFIFNRGFIPKMLYLIFHRIKFYRIYRFFANNYYYFKNTHGF